MKVLALSNCRLDPASGSGRTRLAWSEGLRALGHEVTTIESLELLGGDEGPPSGRRMRIARGAWRLLGRMDLSQVDLIEFYGAEFWLATWAQTWRRQRPLLVAHTDGLEMLVRERVRSVEGSDGGHEPYTRKRGTRLLRWLAAGWKSELEDIAFSRADGFVTASAADAQYLLQQKIQRPETTEVVPLGLERAYLDLPSPGTALSPEREERVAFLGSWIARKGTELLVAAMTVLLRERPTLRLDLYGVGLSAAELLPDFPEDLRARIAVHSRVTIPEIIAGLTRTPVFFFPSEYEGFGLALAEAMACGCAAVTTPTGFGADLRDGEEALVCPFGQVGAMVKAIRALLDDAALCARIAAGGHRRVQSLRWESSVRRLEAIYLRWLEGRTRGRAASPVLAAGALPERSRP